MGGGVLVVREAVAQPHAAEQRGGGILRGEVGAAARVAGRVAHHVLSLHLVRRVRVRVRVGVRVRVRVGVGVRVRVRVRVGIRVSVAHRRDVRLLGLLGSGGDPQPD